MTQRATGFRVHSGWAAAVTLAGPIASPAAVDRRVIQLCDPKIKGSKQPFHAAEALPIAEAEALIAGCRESTWKLARRGLDEIGEIGACGLLLSSGRPLPVLSAILASHALIHTAEGEFFRDAVRETCRERKLPLREVKERDLYDACTAELRLSRARLDHTLGAWGKQIGSPWRQDEKLAALVGWLALLP